ncbi:MAG: 16S rRNA (adenine(1518)-N(6)/adenine(1519)-N(6))-dimethyltransferase RsmA [Bacteroidetes bacterium]|nr:16S rRNA (adenine(1518)-N(6)/adenine(1519)-N(6))-dimethyltransferase RsmA [Bacteroidota bacterium]MCW5895664.1 16S rRNA (adenine(1518)-N(6)/adenine(1519)-N(6))-dimethyltransferase RsmA [Bacteroidota bacterium]
MKTIRPKQSLGQNFLRDENIARKIVGSMNIQPGDLVLEIGPGEGALTKYLAQQTNGLIAVDLDRRAVDHMHGLFPGGEVEILHQDFLESDFGGILRKRTAAQLRIIGNIPYNITSPILFHILDHRQHVGDATLMMQKEVAKRLVAKPGTKDYGILAVFCQLFADVELLFDVSAKCFFPPPKVTSSVVRMKMLGAPRYPVNDEVFFRKMVRSIFGKRRKTLRNSLGYFLDPLPHLPERFDLTRRPENLSLRELAELGNMLATQRE